MKEIKTAALIGLGALGILYGQRMPEVRVIVDRSRLERYSREEVTCNGRPCAFSYVTPEEGQPVDLVMTAVKATALEEAAASMKRFVGPDTVIVSVLNGISSEETLERFYPGHCLWCVAIGLDAVREGRALRYKNAGVLQIGERDGGDSPRLRAVGAYLEKCGIACEICGDILYKQWNKLMINVGLNQAAAVHGYTYGQLRADAAVRAEMLEAMEEVIAVANRAGVPLPRDSAVRWMDGAMDTLAAEGRPSMGQDVLARRPTEVGEFAGLICRLGREYGIPTPVNDFYLRRIREIEAGYGED